MEPDEVLGTLLPHSELGDPECCGCLNGLVHGDKGKVVCNECETVIRSVPAAELQRTIDGLGSKLDPRYWSDSIDLEG
jgi:hypothetical protein